MASGVKRILLSPASPSLQSANKRMAVFPSPQRLAGGPKSPTCSTPKGLGSVFTATVKKRFAQSDEMPSRSRKKLFDFPQVDIPLTTNQVIDSSPLMSQCIPCTPSCATPNEASSLDVEDEREHESASLERKPLSNISNGQKLDNSCRVPLIVENDTPLTTDELLLYALMITLFPTETFSKKHSVEKYERAVKGIHRINGVHYSSESVRNYFYRVRRNEVKGVGKSKGVCRWNYFKECICKLAQLEARALGLLLKGEVLEEIAKVSLIQNLNSRCAETISHKSKEGKSDCSQIQTAVDNLVRAAQADRFQLNEAKCKELQICFARSKRSFPPVVINNKNIEVVKSAKLLGLLISDDLKWNAHVAEIVKKVASRLYLLRQLKRAGLDPLELVCFYTTCIRPVAEYACETFHNSLPIYLSDELERLQKRAFRIIYPTLSYSEARVALGLPLLSARREELTTRLFDKILQDPNHRLHHLLPPKNECQVTLRTKRTFNVPLCKTNRFKRSFLMANSSRS